MDETQVGAGKIRWGSMSSAIHRSRRCFPKPAIRGFGGLKRDAQGATAVEFSLLFAPFIVALVAMIYMGLHHFANAHFDMNVNQVMKRVYESTPICPGSSPTAPYSAACLAQRICEQPNIIMVSAATCKATIRVDFRPLSGNGSDAIPPLFTNTGINAGALNGSATGKPGDIVMLRAAVPFPSWSMWGPYGQKRGGTYYLYATQVMRVRNLDTFSNVRVN